MTIKPRPRLTVLPTAVFRTLTVPVAATLAAMALGSAASAEPDHNGACVGFAGTISGQKYAGLKCYLDSAPGNWVIRSTVKERNDPEQYKKLLRLPKQPVRCTLTKGGTSHLNGRVSTSYQISKC
ncbi:MAG: hypothetical protein JJ911_10595 [Rhizobiaceae bacterium]|nr:hypothetical protein [Rhizobiaceae bacterium]